MAEKKENKKKQSSGTSSSTSNNSFTYDLFGPKDPPNPSSSSSTLFGSVFGPPISKRKQDYGGHYGNPEQGTLGCAIHRGKRESSGFTTSKEKNSSNNNNNNNSNIYQSQTVEPCYLSSSIYYGAQEVYSPTSSQPNAPHSVFMKDGRNDDPNGDGSGSASRGNWWQGSLYY